MTTLEQWRDCYHDQRARADAAEGEIKRMRTGWDADVEWANKLLLERDRYRETVIRLEAALIKCATTAGADVSGGVPTRPPVGEWAVQEVKQLRADYDEALDQQEPRS